MNTDKMSAEAVEVYNKYWDNGVPLIPTFDAINNTMIDLCGVHRGNRDKILADAKSILGQQVSDEQILMCYVMFTGGAIWGMTDITAEMRQMALNTPSSNNP
jgi:hypothetical protein